MKALQLYAGRKAYSHIYQNGLQAADISVIPAAAGGPKGLILGPLDRFIFGNWLNQSSQPIDLIGASIGAWRMTSACLENPIQAFEVFEQAYIQQHYDLPKGKKRPDPTHVSERFATNLDLFYKDRVIEVLSNQRFRVHIVTSRGKHLLKREHKVITPLGYLGAFASNSVHRKALGAWLERVVFSSQMRPLPFDQRDFPTRQVPLTPENFALALRASCSIPFVLQAVHDIPLAPKGAYWDGGITDYHLHLNYKKINGLVLYPHFQKQVIPGWLDKGLKWRHRPSPFLDNMIVLAPNPEWITTLPNAKLPDRTDFTHYGTDLAARVKAWTTATQAAQQLAEEFEAWLQHIDVKQLQLLS